MTALKDLTFKAVLSERVRFFDKMISFLQSIVEILKEKEDSRELDPSGYIHRDLTKIEKNLFNRAFKGILADKREAWRTY